VKEETVLRQIAFFSLILCSISIPLSGAAIGPVGTNQRTIVICVRYTDALSTRLANCSDWVALLNAETNQFYNRATFNQTNFQFETISGGGAPANGWLDLGLASADYEFFTIGQAAIDAADPFVNFSNYNRVLVITSWPGFGGQGGGPWWWRVNEGTEATVTPAVGGPAVPSRLMTLANTNEWLAHSFGNPFDEAASVMAHELGHQLGAPTHYGELSFAPSGTRDAVSPWDIMGFSPTLNHFLGYVKTHRGWIPSGPRIQTVGPPTGPAIDTTILLRPLESSTASPQIIRVPLSSSGPFVGYVVENRRQINGDEALPAQGVLISAVNESPGNLFPAYVLDDPSAPLDLNQATLEIGESFVDSGHNLTITAVSDSGNNTNVRIQYAAPASFDPFVTPWGAPPWETPDIWIDSERNTFGSYLYTDGSGNPVGNGDDAWVDHDNRVHVRVHNAGTGAVTNVRAQVFVNSPPGMGDAGPNWDFIGTIVYPSIAGGGQADGFVLWRPAVAAHTCIKVVLIDTPGEVLTSNNLAQENVTHFDTSPGSPFDPVHLTSIVNNPFDRELPVRIHVRDVPYGWAVVTEPPQMTLPPKGRRPVQITVYPSGLPAHEPDGTPSDPQTAANRDCPPRVKWDREQLAKTMAIGFIGKPKVEAQMPFYDTYVPIGGIDVWTQLARRTQLDCRVRGTRVIGTNLTAALSSALDPRRIRAVPKAPPLKQQPKLPARTAAVDPDRLYYEGAMVRPQPPDPVVAPGSVTIEGTLTPAIAGALIAVEFTQGERRDLKFTKTDEKGNYSITTDARGGRVVAQAHFSGDRENGESESGQCAFLVNTLTNKQ
jgi:M6 family metalloprotease-like protein